MRQSVEILGDHLPAVTLLLRVRGNSEVELAALKRRRVIDDKLAVLVQAAVDEGALRADIAPELISRLLFGMVNSLVEWYRPDGPVPIEDLSTAIVDLAVRRAGMAVARLRRSGSAAPVDRLRPRNSATTVSSAQRVTVTSYSPERPRSARSVGDRDELVAETGRLEEGDVEAGGDRDDAVGVAGEREGAVGECGDQAAVAEVPAVDHVARARSSRASAVPGPTETTSMPSVLEAASPAHIGRPAERRVARPARPSWALMRRSRRSRRRRPGGTGR